MAEILEVLLEIVLQLVFEMLADGFDRKIAPVEKRLLRGLVYMLIGGLLGWSTILVFPHSFIANEIGRIAYLVVVPILIGIAMARIGRAMVVRGKNQSGLETFWSGWLFAFAFAGVRYFATR